MRTNDPRLCTFTVSPPNLTAVSSVPQTLPRPLHKRHPSPSTLNRRSRLFGDTSYIAARIQAPFRGAARLEEKVQSVLEHGWAPGTLDNYGSAVARFREFCRQEHVPAALQLPAHEFVLCAFAASSAGVQAGSTARKNISALKAWHVMHDQPWLAGPRLHYVLSGVENLTPASSKHAPRPPISSAMLAELHRGLDFASPFDVAVYAAACVAFWGQCRLGEILPITAKDKSLADKPTRAHVTHSARSTTLRLPRTKTQKAGEDVLLVDQSSPFNPRTALQMHLTVNSLPLSTPLFAFRDTSGSSRLLTRSLFLGRCNAIWTSVGYPRTTGHSFRIGGTTELLLNNVPPAVVKAMGRWSSDAFMRYWRSLDIIAPLHAANLHQRASRLLG
ncbi:hypothetical protein HMN09_01088800 [Mycena chlorophos]|uniref:DNA breaking-rejoining enzyme n=1 Tax=Mycena chlorophos TaxID=658473 RepID=A0A8H6SCG6_MYCCL|nr:hypothetical protein HMN09_01088800 [Mycena chlorophos]